MIVAISKDGVFKREYRGELSIEELKARGYKICDVPAYVNEGIVDMKMFDGSGRFIPDKYKEKVDIIWADLYSLTVDGKIRLKYTVSQECAILRQKDSKAEEFKEYYDYCEICKREAREDVYNNYDLFQTYYNFARKEA